VFKMAYTDVTAVRLLSGLTTNEISDANITSLITYATAVLNSDINYNVNDELVEYIDAEKENKIDGSNTAFYLKEIKDGYQIGDYDNDGDVDTSDFYAYTIDTSTSPATRATVTVSTIDKALGKIVLSAAPSTTKNLYVSYSVAPFDENTPAQLIKQAATQLVSALAFTNIDAKKLQSFTIGKIRIIRQSDGFNLFMNQYHDTVYKINQRINRFEDNISQDW